MSSSFKPSQYYDELLYGCSFSAPDGTRIDPTKVMIVRTPQGTTTFQVGGRQVPLSSGVYTVIEMPVDDSKKSKLDVKSAKKPTAPAPVSEIEKERLKKAQARQARKDQIRRNGGKR